MNKIFNRRLLIAFGCLAVALFVVFNVLWAQQRQIVSNDASADAAVLSRMRADHVFIGTTKFEETIDWYREKLGFREVVRWKVKEVPDLQLAYLELNNFRIEVVGTSKLRAGAATPNDFAEHLRTGGYAHLCFEVSDVDRALGELNGRGVPTFVPAGTYPLNGYERRVAFVRDNNGNVIEFGEPLRKK